MTEVSAGYTDGIEFGEVRNYIFSALNRYEGKDGDEFIVEKATMEWLSARTDILIPAIESAIVEPT